MYIYKISWTLISIDEFWKRLDLADHVGDLQETFEKKLPGGGENIYAYNFLKSKNHIIYDS